VVVRVVRLCPRNVEEPGIGKEYSGEPISFRDKEAKSLVTVVEVVEEAVVAALRLDCLDDMVAGACDPVS